MPFEEDSDEETNSSNEDDSAGSDECSDSSDDSDLDDAASLASTIADLTSGVCVVICGRVRCIVIS